MTRLTFCLSVLLALPLGATAGEPDVKIGVPRSIFRDVPPSLIAFASQPIKDIIKAQTGLVGDAVNEPDFAAVAKGLADGKLQLGVFLGHEFAWAREKNPKLEGLVCPVPRPKEIQAFLLVRHDCKANDLGDLKGEKLALATNSRDHSRLFLEKKRVEAMLPESYCSIEKTTTVHESIHKVIEGEAEVTVVDAAAWNYFQKIQPGAASNLKVLAQSEVFPATVIAYQKGSLSEEKVKALRDGMLTAHQNAKGAKLMNLIRMDRFDPVPADYCDRLKACLKLYPTAVSFK